MGTRFQTMYDILPPVIEQIRRGGGPALVEACVVRLDPHFSSDDQKKYRQPEELAALSGNDPIPWVEAYLTEQGVLEPTRIAEIRSQIKAEVDQAAEEADASPLPGGADLLAHIYANDAFLVSPPTPPRYVSDQEITLIDAVNHGLREEMDRNPRIVMWGEDIAIRRAGFSV